MAICLGFAKPPWPCRPPARGEELEGGSSGVRTGNRRTKGAGRSCVGPVPGSPFAAPALGIKAHGGV
jgi:hypothetical protein